MLKIVHVREHQISSLKHQPDEFVLHFGYFQTNCTLSSLCLPDLICLSFFFFILSVYIVWIFLLPFYHVLDCFSTWGCIFHFFICFQVCWDKEAKVILKSLYFSLFLNLITEILSRSISQMLFGFYCRQSCKQFAFIYRIYYISKLLT